jgi:hypothetical protein
LTLKSRIITISTGTHLALFSASGVVLIVSKWDIGILLSAIFIAGCTNFQSANQGLDSSSPASSGAPAGASPAPGPGLTPAPAPAPAPPPAQGPGQVTGWVEGFFQDSSGPALHGWTCVIGSPASIQVDVYVGGPAGIGTYAGRFDANASSEPAIAAACSSAGASYRYDIQASPSAIQQFGGKTVYVYGIPPAGVANNTLLGNSGNITVPSSNSTPMSTTAPVPNPTVPPGSSGSVTVGQPFLIYDAGADQAGCAPLLDGPMYPISFPAGGGSVEIRFNAESAKNGGNNYWVIGQMDAVGHETTGFRANCNVTLNSPHNSNSSLDLGSQWLNGFYKLSDGSIYSVVHNEYYGGYFPPGLDFSIPSSPGCSLGVPYGNPVNPFNCTYTTLDLAVMPSGASSFSMAAAAPAQEVANPSFGYAPNFGLMTGYAVNSNIYQAYDGYYYFLTIENFPDSSQKSCPVRTQNLADPSSWRGWDGSGYSAVIHSGQDCANVNLPVLPFYLGYNTYFQEYISVGAMAGVATQYQMGYSLSSDFVNWSTPVGLGIPIFNGPNNYPSLFDVGQLQNTQDSNASTGAITGQAPWLIYVENGSGGSKAVAVGLSFSK